MNMSDKIIKFKLNTLTEPKNGVYKIYKDYYWVVDKDDNVLNYGGYSWQCNSNRDVMENILSRNYPDCRLEQIPVVYTEWNG